MVDSTFNVSYEKLQTKYENKNNNTKWKPGITQTHRRRKKRAFLYN